MRSIVLLSVLLLPHSAVAELTTMAAAGNGNSIEQTFCNVVLIMTGTTGKAVATVGIIGLGVGALFGKISWNSAMLSTMSVGLIFGAMSIVDDLGGGPAFALILGNPGLTQNSDQGQGGNAGSAGAGAGAGTSGTSGALVTDDRSTRTADTTSDSSALTSDSTSSSASCQAGSIVDN